MSYPARIAIVKGKKAQLVVKVGDRWRKGVEVRCANCGYSVYIPKPMIKRNYEGKNNSQKHYCSQSCYQKTRKRKYATNLCVICNAPFQVRPPSHASRHKTCSDICKTKHRSQLMSARHQR